ncbi:hypothetical protein T05_5222, partial [Trichinella murrelli]
MISIPENNFYLYIFIFIFFHHVTDGQMLSTVRHCRGRVATVKRHGVQSVERSRVILDHQEGYGSWLA